MKNDTKTYVKFENDGEIDPRLITTMGVNVKGVESPIGYFGTGLKYAIAQLLAKGHEIIIDSGLRRFTFEARPEEIRGKTFGMIYMTEGNADGREALRLGFTTELGKNWEPWMLYRELTSNCLDEGGEVSVVSSLDRPRQNVTTIYASGLTEPHSKRNSIFLPKAFRPTLSDDVLQIFSSNPGTIYYRGVQVKQNEKPSAFSYNFLRDLTLTEDRTLKYAYQLDGTIIMSVVLSKDEDLIQKFLLAPTDSYEFSFNWDQFHNGYALDTTVFDSVAARLLETRAGTMNRSVWARIETNRANLGPIEMELTNVERKMLEKAKVFLSSINIHVSNKIVVAENLGQSVLGLAKHDTIYVSRRAFEVGTKCVAGTILEEWCHLEKDFVDGDRPFQNWLIDKIVSLGEELTGEPL